VIAASLGAGFLGGAMSTARTGGDAPTTVSAQVSPVSLETTANGIDVAGVLDHAEGSVVSISATVRSQRGPFQSTGESAGTGVVISNGGTILTNAHVVSGATNIVVTGIDGVERSADLIAADEANDIAVLRVHSSDGLDVAELGTSDSVTVGEPVVAIGNALALEGSMTVTQGIVSAKDRSIETSSGTLDDLIQTDAAISSGNSGGPLVDAEGRVIGINTAVAASGSGIEASNIGFAISIDTALDIAQSLMAGAA